MRRPRVTEGRIGLLVFVGCALLYLPFCGSYGFWDPWESHYAEVARQMVARGDWLSLWWPGSPFDPPEFFSKPVLTFWIEALSFRLVGLGHGPPGEMALSSAAEWAARVPHALLGSFGVWSVFYATARLLGRRAALLAAVVCATSPIYALISRQAMTDMPFTSTLTAALCFGALALFDEDRELGRRPVVAFAAVLALLVVPQLVVDVLALDAATFAFYPLLLAWLGVRLARLRRRAALLALWAFTLCGVATLAKGLAGAAIPLLVLAAYVVALRDWKALRRVDWIAGVLCFLVVALPWYHAMLARHGEAFFEEFIAAHHWRRLVGGVHGERGGFDYFARELGYGMLPWIPVAVAAVAGAVARERDRFGAFVLLWGAVVGCVITLSATKFHHYALPLVPPVAILCGWYLASLSDGSIGARGAAVVMGCLGLPALALATWDLVRTAQAAERLLWLFDYDYMLGGLPWPGHDYRAWIVAFASLSAIGVIALWSARARRAATIGLAAVAVGFTLFLIDGFLPRLAPHWSQKQTVATYFRERKPDEKLIAWTLYFRGETFYSSNVIYDENEAPRDRGVCLGADADRNLLRHLERNKGKRLFVMTRAPELAALKRLLPDDVRPRFRLIDESNNKVVLGVIEP